MLAELLCGKKVVTSPTGFARRVIAGHPRVVCNAMKGYSWNFRF